MIFSHNKSENPDFKLDSKNNKYFTSKELAYLFIVINLLIALLLLLAFSSEKRNKTVNHVVDGRFHVTSDILKNKSIISLAGDWNFKWYPVIPEDIDNSIIPENFTKSESVPGYWKTGSTGLGIYNLKIILDDKMDIPALKLTNVMDTYKLFINNKECYSVGNISSNPDKYRDESRPVVIPLPKCSQKVDITLMVGNLTEKRGGLNRAIFFGEYENLKNLREKLLVYNSILLGISLTVIFYNILFLLINRKNGGLNHIFLIILCFTIIFYCGLKQEMMLKTYFTGLTGEMRAKLIYLSFLLPFPVFACYIKSIYSRIFGNKTYKIIITTAVLITLFILIFKSTVFSRFLIFLEIANLFLALFLTARLLYIYIKTKDTTPLTQLIGLYIFISGFVAAILDDNLAIPSVAPFILFTGFVIYLTSGNTILSIRSYNRMNQLHNALMTSEKDKENLRKLSYIDSLTGISNRRHFEEYIRLHWEKINFIGEPSALFMIDIDNFKLFNDTYGHQEGDECLKKVASTMNIELNRGNDIMFRYGGEEFTVILSNINRVDAYRIAEKLRKKIENLKIDNKNSLYIKHITVSIGISYYNPGKKLTGWEKTLKQSDEALYKAKIKRNSCVIFDEENDKKSGNKII